MYQNMRIEVKEVQLQCNKKSSSIAWAHVALALFARLEINDCFQTCS